MAPRLATPSGSQSFWAASAAALGALALVAAALWLEHLCRLPVGPPDDRPRAPAVTVPSRGA